MLLAVLGQQQYRGGQQQYRGMVKYIQNYVLYESIGSGVYGKVYRAINNTDKKEYAIKVIPITKFKQNKKLQECTVNEINILTNIENHPNIIKYYDMLKTSNNFYFIYEFCNGGTLENLLSKQLKLSEPNALLIFKQLLEAFQILNKYNIMHRDMKPDNIFFHNGVIKLGDFGFCKNLNSADQMTKTMLGSPIYMAPEVLKGEIYSNKADIWSLGVVLYEMIFGVCPFQSNSIANLIEVLNSKQLQFPGPCSAFMKGLITRMLTKDSVRRISWMELFQIKINNQGQVESEKITQKINSLNEAKILEEGQSMPISSKMIGKAQSMNGDEPVRDFKKNRNISALTPNINIGPNVNHPPNPNSPTLPPNNNLNANSKQSASVASATTNSSSSNPNMMSPANNKLGNQVYVMEGQKSPPASYSKELRVGEEHKMILEGVKLAIEIIETKIPNHMGYAHLLLSRTINVLGQLVGKSSRKELTDLLDKQIKEIEAEREMINSKMFAYELKGLEDWKKYLRGKFFQEENTIVHWYRMVTFLNGTYGTYNLTQATPAEIVKQILY